jgi:hypothetical protein
VDGSQRPAGAAHGRWLEASSGNAENE